MNRLGSNDTTNVFNRKNQTRACLTLVKLLKLEWLAALCLQEKT